MRFKYTAILLIVCFLFTVAQGQYYDSVSFVNANWKLSRVDKKVKYHDCFFEGKKLFQSNQHISYVILKRQKRRYRFGIAAETKLLRTVSEFAKDQNALAAINGNFFDVKNGGSVDYTKVGNRILNISRKEENEKPNFHQKAAVVINNGKLNIAKWDGFVNWEEWLKDENVLLNGPLLFINKIDEILDTSSFYTARHPRTCVGITKKGSVIMLVVDGRNANAAGMSIAELRKIMHWLGCISAINFDGGGSSTLWIKNRNVVNYPSDNGQWDHNGGRKVANALYLKKR